MLKPYKGRPRRPMTALSSIRRRVQKLGPYQSLILMLAPLLLVEPLKLIALVIAGKGHWLNWHGDRGLRSKPTLRRAIVSGGKTEADAHELVR
jgi:hypothetical protein